MRAFLTKGPGSDIVYMKLLPGFEVIAMKRLLVFFLLIALVLCACDGQLCI